MRNASLPYWLSAPALTFYALCVAAPLAATFLLSLNGYQDGIGVLPVLGLGNYAQILSDPYFHLIFGRTFVLALAVTALCILLGAPEAYILYRMEAPWRGLFLTIILGPLLIAVVVRTLGWALLFGSHGAISQTLQMLELADRPISLMYTMTGMVIALVHVLVPFVVIAVWASLQRLDRNIELAGESLGASQLTILRRLVLPQVIPAIVSGSIIVFSLAATAFATPSIIGGRRLKVVATLVYDEFLTTLNWPLGAAIAVLMLIANIALILTYSRLMERRRVERQKAVSVAFQEKVA
ncbi:ABC transporter permease [Nitratireductor thuwali]|uniref:Spermidine/putrescine transport system permease protein PotB n=1 Tax=Nitratireductor thuwali TaxID=2267699 RepID=A0ABY5MV15_9HYPH|nr:Spermidine/putrescine transport system permease protein PotB [Nitratireductor thuwali]